MLSDGFIRNQKQFTCDKDQFENGSIHLDQFKWIKSHLIQKMILIHSIFSILTKNTVYDRVFDYVYGDVNEVETAEIIDADEKAEVKSVERSAEGHSQEAADVNIEEDEAHQV